MAQKFQVVSGTFGVGRGIYDAGRFLLPGGVKIAVASVEEVHENGTVLQGGFFTKLRSSGGTALAAAQLGALSGLFAGGIALVGPWALTAAAVGAGVGYIGGQKKKSLVQVIFNGRTGFVAIAPDGFTAIVRNDKAVIDSLMASRSSVMIDVTPKPMAGNPDSQAALQSLRSRAINVVGNVGSVTGSAVRLAGDTFGAARDKVRKAVPRRVKGEDGD